MLRNSVSSTNAIYNQLESTSVTQADEKKSSTLNKPIGIFGGTFDPPHYGHIENAKLALQSLQLHAVHFVPCYKPAHRVQPVASSEHRLQMVRIAIAEYKHFILNQIEYERNSPSTTIETLELLRHKYPNTPLCLIIGMDNLLGLTSWKRWIDIFNFAHIIVLQRPSYTLKKADKFNDILRDRFTVNPADLHQSLSGRIYICPISLQLDISSTLIREKLTQGEIPTNFLPKSVIDYVKKNSLYSNQLLNQPYQVTKKYSFNSRL